MKQITNEQIKSIIDTFYQLNAPVKLYAELKNMLETLPNVEQVEVKEEEVSGEALDK